MDERETTAIPIFLTIAQAPDSDFPSTTAWYAVARHPFPLAGVEIYPATQGGLSKTYPHQRRNAAVSGRLWRAGNVCLEDWFTKTKRGTGFSEEPTLALAERVEALVDWVTQAASGTLVRAEDPFEFPDWCGESQDWLIYWGTEAVALSGTKDVKRMGPAVVETPAGTEGRRRIVVVRRLQQLKPTPLFSWTWRGPPRRLPGIWMDVGSLPIKPVHGGIENGQELLAWLAKEEVSLREGLLLLNTEQLHSPEIAVLFRCPTPRRYGRPENRFSFHGFWLKAAPRIRLGRHWLASQLVASLRSQQELDWMKPYDIAPSEHYARGRLSSLASLHFVIVGLGALGSHIAEQLIRAGVDSLTLVDGEDMEPGNTTRHVLTMRDVGSNKASAMERRLLDVNPTAQVTAIPKPLSASWIDSNRQLLGAADWIVDCSAEDEVLHALSNAPKVSASLFSAAFTFNMEKLVAYCESLSDFEVLRYREATDPLFEPKAEDDEYLDKMPGPHGCQNPLMPGTNVAASILAARAVLLIDQIVRGERSFGSHVVNVADGA